uniref:Uncharacterized protein n=1 Tax=viral metagenome TaxID=1070528 RepID=A0A6M3J020_9ZZZZ
MSITVLEVLECAKINFNNVNRMSGGILSGHPIYMLAMEQLTIATKAISEGKSGDDLVPEEEKP